MAKWWQLLRMQFSKKLSELTIRGAKNNGVYSNNHKVLDNDRFYLLI